ncbi:Receptor-type guanylate cyclase gcy [Seminavis robusta]|uniref:Receptor-type guanylate cyclase gcy n=1 Tax=Seminavis robusta TaxID=568900 RepID=A0A9N8D8G0_9STRA|nr:Receptor-type guanylate cyclase gcy [Seminavis robusta]|eukprot:Sro34_g022100.1 Receptor-type guanylate cyclase gcy (1176) ;mRNA; r:133302-137908
MTMSHGSFPGGTSGLSDASSLVGSGVLALDELSQVYENDDDSNLLDFLDETNGSSVRSNSASGGGSVLEKQSLDMDRIAKKTYLVAFLVVLVGALASASFLYLGISNANGDQKALFERRAAEMKKEIVNSWHDYELATLWIHESCRNWRTDNMTRMDFRVLYQYLIYDQELEFFAAEWIPNATHAERAAMEQRASQEWPAYQPGFNYTGFKGLQPNPDKQEGAPPLTVQHRSEQPWYFPMHFMEPVKNLGGKGHLDLFTVPNLKPAILQALSTMKPALTAPFILVHETEAYGNSVVLFHPGPFIPQDLTPNVQHRDLSNMVVKVRDLLTRASRNQGESLAAHLYDITSEDKPPMVMGGIEIRIGQNASSSAQDKTDVKDLSFPQVPLDQLDRSSKLFFEADIAVASRTWKIAILPVDDSYQPDLTFIVISGSMIFLASLLLAIWMLHNLRKSIKMQRIITTAAAEASIVSSLFPEKVRERLIQDATAAKAKRTQPLSKAQAFLNNGSDKNSSDKNPFRPSDQLTSEGLFGSKPIAELHPYTTVVFMDMVGFTAWSSVREASQVFTLLEILYNSFDNIAKRRRVFKVETVGDCYVAVSGVPEPRKNHAVVIARFANDCIKRMHQLSRALETTLGPDTADLALRVGIHSGQVTAGVLRGDKGRFQLFGDTVNMAARMESTGAQNKIHCSAYTAELISEAGFEKWIVPREEKINIKGKGRLQTYFVRIISGSKASKASVSAPTQTPGARDTTDREDAKTTRLVNWNLEVLSKLLRRVLARRHAMNKPRSKASSFSTSETSLQGCALETVQEIIALPGFSEAAISQQVDPDSIVLDDVVVDQLQGLITKISAMYRNNSFHSFEHASHVLMSVDKMMTRILAPKEIVSKKAEVGCDLQRVEAELHTATFGLTSEPMIQFACAYAALIHDLDHQGVPNSTLVTENDPLAVKYNNKSVAERNSLDLAWDLFHEPEYKDLLNCICGDAEEYQRFRHLVVNSVMATDIMDKELGAARKNRWNKAFSEEKESEEEDQMAVNRKATIVIEHLIQASDISHTMQHWHVYVKWNERLFHELYRAYKTGRIEKDPSEGWYQGELGFFDFYIIPLAKKLFTCGVFGVSSDEFLNYARTNRAEWEQKGEALVEQYLMNYKHKFGDDVRVHDDCEQSHEQAERLPVSNGVDC